ncbi:MAG: hypothetical protein EOP35_17145 [Rubrivivax sp.]|nr:MAG: hypothetical protein EOP35_17145 [Rubrivivax sp.]
MSGLTLTVGGRVIPLLPLNYKQLKAQKENIRLMTVGGFEDAFHIFDTLAPVIHASLQRTVPDLQLEDVEEALDQPTAVVLANEVIRLSFPQAQPGETTDG